MDVLLTDRLILRKLTKEDIVPMFNNWASDPEVSKYVTWPTHKSVKETEAVVNIWLEEYKNPKTVRFGIVLKDTNELIGSIDIAHFVNDVPEIGYCLSRKHWNKGYMTEAFKRLIEYLFDIGYTKIVIEALENNIGSNRVIEKCGFTFTHKETKEASPFKKEIVTVNWYEKIK